ncbi:MAG: alpha/beta fold hydrolase [Dehalococcoidia bacterium]
MTKRKTIIGSLAAALLVVVYFGLSLVIVNTALVAEANPVDGRPEELGLTYEDVSFAPRGSDGITLRGWWFPNDDAPGTVIWVHGLDNQRSEQLDLIRDLLAQGFQVLAFDLRGHGESDLAPMGAGLLEQDDVLGAVDFVMAERDVEPGKVLLMGKSFGGAIVLMAGVREPAVVGVYADSAFADLSDVMIDEVADRTPIPRWGARLLRPGLVFTARLFKGIDIGEVRPERSVAAYPYLVGLTHCDADERVPLENVIRLRAAAPPGSWFNIYPDCAHADAYLDFSEQYVAIVTNYFNERLGVE